ncbi:MAG: PHP-associated domain-containing protein [Anaerolineae bacterium]|nr:PHP-associated domain-containing protein [Anaerolineae bacterium]
MFKVDLHVHSSERSACGKSPVTAMVESAIAHGLDALMLTDHDRLAPPAQLQALNRRYAPFRIYGGIEVTVGSEHVLVLGVQHPALEYGDWRYPELHHFVRARGGFLAVAHPFRYHDDVDLDIEAYPPDALEGYSWNTPAAYIERITALAQRLGVPLLANSDAHHVERFGYYYNLLDVCPPDEVALLEALREGHFACYAPEGVRAP